jgi:hypothetical protein
MDLGQLTGSDLVGPVRLVSRSRDIKLEKFTQALELDSERGDVELEPAVPMPSIEVRAGTGRIDLVLPPKAAFDLTATAEHGEAVNDFGPPIEKSVEGRTMTLKGRVGDGPSVRLTTSRGSVAVRKEGTPTSDNAQDDDPKPAKKTKAKATQI